MYVNHFPDDGWDAVARFRLVFEAGRWRTVSPRGMRRTARGLFLFVVQDGEIFVAKVCQLAGAGRVIHHADLGRGRDVEFAGEIRFGSGYHNRGGLRSWNHRSGHYRPDREGRRIVPVLPQALFED